MDRRRILFVCLGNICRSPMAEGVFRRLTTDRVSEDRTVGGWHVDSAGTENWHAGSAPDTRAQAALWNRGIDISRQRARQVRPDDFNRFDLLLAMDATNLQDLRALAPRAAGDQAQLLLDYALGLEGADVPDPYYGGPEGFEDVCDLLERAAHGLLRRLG